MIYFLKELEKLDKTKYIIVASSAMVAFNVIEKNNDIDIIIDPEYKKHLIQKNIIQKENNKYKIGEHIDCGYVNNPFDYFTIKSFGTQEIDGYQILNLTGLIKFYSLFNKEKYKKRIEIISSYLSQLSNHLVYHGSYIQNLKTIQPYKSFSYPLLDKIVFASQNKTFAKLFGYKWRDDDINISWTKTELNPLEYTFILKIKHPLKNTNKPFSVYTLDDISFKQLIKHPILELYSNNECNVLNEIKYSYWKEELLGLENEKEIKIINREFLIY